MKIAGVLGLPSPERIIVKNVHYQPERAVKTMDYHMGMEHYK
jgi:hypothetical protein